MLVYQRVSFDYLQLNIISPSLPGTQPFIIDVNMCAADDQCSKTLIPFNPGGSYKVVPPKAKCVLVYNPHEN